MRPRAVLVPAEAGNGAVRRALVLDLDHRPLARLVRPIEPLCDDAVEPGALEPVEPVDGSGAVGRRRCQVDRRVELARELPLEEGAALSLWRRSEVDVVER